jgi:GGDEF domain-containing protein
VLEPLVSACGAFGGEAGPAAALRTVEALHAVLWSALRAELRDPEPDLVYDLAARLDAVCELVRTAAVSRQGREEGATRVAPVPAVVSVAPGGGPGGPQGAAGSPVADPAWSEAPGPVLEADPGPTLADEPDLPPPTPLRPVFSATARRDRNEVLWVAALEEEVVRSRRSGAALSLLLVELEDGDRLAQSELGAEAAAAFGRFPQAVRSVLRRQDLLASEAQTRVWVIARDTARPGARALGDRIAAAVGELGPLHGAPLTVNVGLAVLGEDAHDCSSLLEAAEEAAFTAAAVGDQLAEHVPQDLSGEGPGAD